MYRNKYIKLLKIIENTLKIKSKKYILNYGIGKWLGSQD